MQIFMLALSVTVQCPLQGESGIAPFIIQNPTTRLVPMQSLQVDLTFHVWLELNPAIHACPKLNPIHLLRLPDQNQYAM